MKKLFSLLIALTLCVSMISGAFAASTDVSWSSHMELPSQQEMSGHSANDRAPYIVGVPEFGGSGKWTDYVVDFRADHLPKGTYLCVCNFDLDTSPLLKKFASVSRDYPGVGGYCGFQRGYDGKGYAIMTVWDTYCRDRNGNLTIIRANGIYPANGKFERFEDDTVRGEGCFIHCLVPYDWQEGKNYRAAIQMYNSRLIFWVEDLETSRWTQLMEYDLGYEGATIQYACTFLEDFSQDAHGYLRSMALSNFRVRDSKDGKWIGTTKLRFSENYEYSGSYNYGSEGNVFWAITTHIPGRCRIPVNDKLYTVRSCDSSAPY